MANRSSWIYKGQQPSEKVKPGDMIEISRKGGLYKHWTLYMGGNKVMHLVPLPHSLTKAIVKQEKLEKVVGTDQWRVNNYLDEKYVPRDIQDILEEARKLKGKVVPYELCTKNCEHMVTNWRYREPESRQVRDGSAISAVSVVMIVVIIAVSSVACHRKKRKEKDCQKSTYGSTKKGGETVSEEEDESTYAHTLQRSSTGRTEKGGKTVSEEEDESTYVHVGASQSLPYARP